MRSYTHSVLSLLLALPCAASATTPAAADPAVAAWVGTVAERNATAADVAAYKFTGQRPIEDPVREAQILLRKRDQALAAGLDPEDVETTYRQLMEANKLLQHVAFQRYRLGGRPGPAPPLEQTRQRIDALDERLFVAWPSVEAARQAADCPATLARAIQARQTPGEGAQATPSVQTVARVRALITFCRPAPPARASSAEHKPPHQQE